LRLGVPLLPSQRYQPEGIAFDAPDHMPINPDGIPVEPAVPSSPF